MIHSSKAGLAKALGAAPLFCGLPEGDLQALAGAASLRRYPKGTDILTEGSPADSLYIVHTGQVRIYKTSPEGKEHVLGIMGPGQPIGEVALFSGRVYPASARVLEDAVCAVMSRDAFVSVVSRHPQVALSIIATLSERLRGFARQVEGLSLKAVHSRLADYLLTNGKGGDHVDLDIPKSQLARLLGTVPETLSRNLARLKDAGIISVDGSRIHLLDTETLRELADGGKLE